MRFVVDEFTIRGKSTGGKDQLAIWEVRRPLTLAAGWACLGICEQPSIYMNALVLT
jgi:hypothetical protein